MMACYLARRRRLLADAAIAEIRRMRPGSVDSAKQENAVHLYVQSLAKKQIWLCPAISQFDNESCVAIPFCVLFEQILTFFSKY